MSCRNIRRRLSAFSDRELPERLLGSIAQHLASCDDCRQALARIRSLDDAFHSERAIPPPEGLTRQILIAAQDRSPARRRRQWWVWDRTEWRDLASVPARAFTVIGLAAGLIAGSVMGLQTWPKTPLLHIHPDPVAIFRLDYLGDAPTGSLADTYVSLVDRTSEEHHE